MTPRVAAAFELLPEYLGWHVLLSVSALALGLVISLPLAIAAARSPRLRWPVLAFASLIQTIPSLALLALFFPLLLALSALSLATFGKGFSALGFLPSLLALNAPQNRRSADARFKNVHVRNRVIDDQRVSRSDHRLSNVGVQIKCADDRYVRPDDIADGGKQLPFDVRMFFGRHRAVQGQQDRIDGPG